MSSLPHKKLWLYFLFAISIFASPLCLSAVNESSPIQEINSQKTYICVTMIVKNESKIIERCLDHVKEIADCISICDTGSNDGTKEIIEEFMKKNRILGKVHSHEWKNFGHNRTLSIAAAKETLQQFGLPASNTYLLLIDADMILVTEADFDKKALVADMYHIIQKNSCITYYNTRLVKASLPWECIGVTHEYWGCKAPCQDAQLNTLWIDDKNDGGCKADKFERDISLLTQGLKDEPENERYMFYLAQSYKCLQKHNEAIRWYKARIQKGGWKEEIWYSKLMIGESYEDLGYWDQALRWYLDAYEYCNERSEPLRKIATHYRLLGQNDLAYLFAKQGARIPYPKDHLLFISHPTYEYEFLEELSIVSYYTPFKEEGFDATDQLVLKKEIPWHVKDNARRTLLFYVQNIKYDEIKSIDFNLPLLREGVSERFNPTNPSIQKRSDGYDVICRTVNYGHKGGLEYYSRDDSDQTIRTRNYLLHYDKNFNLLSQREIIENLDRPKNGWITGLEDSRLIDMDNNDWFMSTTYDTHPGTVGQSLCKFSKTQNAEKIFVETLFPLKGPDPNLCEKNWLPFVKEDKLLAIYGYDPFIIYQINKENGECSIVRQSSPFYDFSSFRGSAPPIEFDNGYLLLIHEVIFVPERKYLHRFVYLDSDLNIKKVSKPFTFLHQGIEYSCGMTINHEKSKCVVSIGYEDQKAHLVFVDLETIRKMLKQLP